MHKVLIHKRILGFVRRVERNDASARRGGRRLTGVVRGGRGRAGQVAGSIASPGPADATCLDISAAGDFPPRSTIRDLLAN